MMVIKTKASGPFTLLKQISAFIHPKKASPIKKLPTKPSKHSFATAYKHPSRQFTRTICPIRNSQPPTSISLKILKPPKIPSPIPTNSHLTSPSEAPSTPKILPNPAFSFPLLPSSTTPISPAIRNVQRRILLAYLLASTTPRSPPARSLPGLSYHVFDSTEPAKR